MGPFLLGVVCAIKVVHFWDDKCLGTAHTRALAEKEMREQMARVRQDFGSIEDLRSGAVFKRL